jgi:hypothetical protein
MVALIKVAFINETVFRFGINPLFGSPCTEKLSCFVSIGNQGSYKFMKPFGCSPGPQAEILPGLNLSGAGNRTGAGPFPANALPGRH